MLIILSGILLISCIFSIIGPFIIYKKQSYFADAIAHSTLFAAVIMHFLKVKIFMAIVINGFTFGLLYFLINQSRSKKQIDQTSLIFIVSNLFISVGILVYNILPVSINIENLIFGNIIFIGQNDLIIFSVLLVTLLIFIKIYYKEILFLILNEDLAKTYNVNISKLNFIWIMLISTALSVTVEIVGLLLISTIIIVPSICGRIFSLGPIANMVFAFIISTCANLIGFYISFYYYLSFAPMVALLLIFIYFICLIYRKISSN